MHYLFLKLFRSDRTTPSCSKRCNYIKLGVLSKRIKPNLVKKCSKSGHTASLRHVNIVDTRTLTDLLSPMYIMTQNIRITNYN